MSCEGCIMVKNLTIRSIRNRRLAATYQFSIGTMCMVSLPPSTTTTTTTLHFSTTTTPPTHEGTGSIHLLNIFFWIVTVSVITTVTRLTVWVNLDISLSGSTLKFPSPWSISSLSLPSPSLKTSIIKWITSPVVQHCATILAWMSDTF